MEILRRHLERRLVDQLLLAGYELVEMPIIDSAELFLTRAGDSIIDKLFTFDRHGRQFALRPEFTAAAAARYAAGDYRGSVRWQFSGPIFEDHPSNQRHSVGAELIGQAGVLAEAELISTAWQALRAVGFSDACITIGHVGLQSHLMQQFQLDKRTYRLILSYREALQDPDKGIDYVTSQIRSMLPQTDAATYSSVSEGGDHETQAILDVLLDSTRYGSTMGSRSRSDIADRLLQKRRRATEWPQIIEAIYFLSEWVSINATVDEAFTQIDQMIMPEDQAGQAIFADWQELIRLLTACGIRHDQIVIQPNLARDWEYYTGIVFGVRAPDDRFVLGGGRYDELVRIISGKHAVPAVGFAYYVDAMMDFVTAPPGTAQTIYTIHTSTETEPGDALAWAGTLHKHGVPAIVSDQQADNDVTLVLKPDNTVEFLGQPYSQNAISDLVDAMKAVRT